MADKVYLETFGCQMNVADSERVQTRLREAGYQTAESVEAADAVIFNTCSVRARAEQKLYSRIGEVRKQRINAKTGMPVIGVMGCVAQLEGAAIFDRTGGAVQIVAGTRATDRLPGLLRAAFAEARRQLMDLGERREDEPDWNVSPSERHSPCTAFVPVIEGCNKFCSFCIVPYSRGRERSRSARAVVDEVARLRDEGFREVHLIGQNVNSYRPRNDYYLDEHAGAIGFSKLLRAVARTGIERIKFTTSFPRDFHHDIVRALEEHGNLCDWVHLPVQSGNDRVLKAMRRGYSAIDYMGRVAAIKNSSRKLALTGDIIVGFPGETRAEFADTLRLVSACEYDGLFVFKYSPRKGTPAAALDGSIEAEEMSERFQALDELQMKIQQRLYRNYINQEVKVLVEGVSSKSLTDMTGHTTCHKVINFPGTRDVMGQIVIARITEAKAHSLRGERV